MAGLKCPKTGVSQEEGFAVIAAIEKYKKFSNQSTEKMSANDFLEY